MEYHKVQLSDLRSIAFRRASNAVVGAWLRLIGLCSERENGGVIADDCSEWDDGDWKVMCGITLEDVQAVVASGLATWESSRLCVIGYDIVGEESHRFNRKVGKRGGRPKKNRSDNRSVNPPDNRSPNRSANPFHTIPNQTRRGEEQKTPPPSDQKDWLPEGEGDRGTAPPVEVVRAKPKPHLAARLLAKGVPFALRDGEAWQALADAHGEERIESVVDDLMRNGAKPAPWAVAQAITANPTSAPRKVYRITVDD